MNHPLSDESRLSAGEFGAAFTAFLTQSVRDAPVQAAVFATRLGEHFGVDPRGLPILTEMFEESEHPNLQLALLEYVAQPGRSADIVGINSEHKRYAGVRIADLLEPVRPGLGGSASPTEGPVEYVNVELAEDRRLRCVQSGLFLVRDVGDAGEHHQRLAVLVSGPMPHDSPPRMRVDVMGSQEDEADRFLAELRVLMQRLNVYRGHAVSLSSQGWSVIKVNFHRLPNIGHEDVILPAGVLERVERHTIGFARHRDAMLAAGHHLKRGLLLHGPPGTGKTLTALYLAGQMHDRTILILTGSRMGLIQRACAMARVLQPAIVIMEDVDLVAEERTVNDCNSLLFELLNEMDGLQDDSDVIFLLTSNRPDLLEPALADRPGRIDQALEIPLPDASCRRRLIDLYSRKVILQGCDLESVVDQTEGVSAAFIRELLRKATLFALEAGGTPVIEQRHLDEALHDLTVAGGEVTRSLLGARHE